MTPTTADDPWWSAFEKSLRDQWVPNLCCENVFDLEDTFLCFLENRKGGGQKRVVNATRLHSVDALISLS